MKVSLQEVFPFLATWEVEEGKTRSATVLVSPKNRKAYMVTSGGIGGQLQAEIQNAILEEYDRLVAK